MPDSTGARWDADQQRWAEGARPGPAGLGTPPQPNIPALVLVSLVVLLVVVAVGIRVGASAENGSPTADGAGSTDPSDEAPSGEPTGGGCESGSVGGHCDAEEDQEGFGNREAAEEDLEGETPEEEEAPAPDGYELRTDSNGFELHVPEGWQREDEGPPEGVFYLQDGRRDLIQIAGFEGAHDSPQEAMDALESGVRGNAGFFSYEQDYLGGESLAVELNYVYDHSELGTRDVYARTFLGGDGEVYAVLAAGSDDDWQLTQERYQTAADSFCVTGYDCP